MFLQVYAVEMGDAYLLAKDVVAENNMQDVIEVIHGRVEDIQLNVKVCKGAIFLA